MEHVTDDTTKEHTASPDHLPDPLDTSLSELADAAARCSQHGLAREVRNMLSRDSPFTGLAGDSDAVQASAYALQMLELCRELMDERAARTGKTHPQDTARPGCITQIGRAAKQNGAKA